MRGMANFQFDGQLHSITDGDSLWLLLDRGFHDTSLRKFRLMGVDTPEVFRGSTLERRAGGLAKTFVWRWMESAAEHHDGDWPLTVKTVKPSKFGDVLARVKRKSDGQELGLELLDVGLARIYLGDKKTPWPDETLYRILKTHA